jgi:hypothetical protein
MARTYKTILNPFFEMEHTFLNEIPKLSQQQTYKHTNIHTYKQTNRHTNRHTYKQTYIHTYIKTNIHTYKQTKDSIEKKDIRVSLDYFY